VVEEEETDEISRKIRYQELDIKATEQVSLLKLYIRRKCTESRADELGHRES
jgi:hypothetical protein